MDGIRKEKVPKGCEVPDFALLGHGVKNVMTVIPKVWRAVFYKDCAGGWSAITIYTDFGSCIDWRRHDLPFLFMHTGQKGICCLRSLSRRDE